MISSLDNTKESEQLTLLGFFGFYRVKRRKIRPKNNIQNKNPRYELYADSGDSLFFEPLVGFEPTTPRLQITCSGQLS